MYLDNPDVRNLLVHHNRATLRSLPLGKRDLEHVQEIDDVCRNILLQSYVGPRTFILGEVPPNVSLVCFSLLRNLWFLYGKGNEDIHDYIIRDKKPERNQQLEARDGT